MYFRHMELLREMLAAEKGRYTSISSLYKKCGEIGQPISKKLLLIYVNILVEEKLLEKTENQRQPYYITDWKENV